MTKISIYYTSIYDCDGLILEPILSEQRHKRNAQLTHEKQIMHSNAAEVCLCAALFDRGVKLPPDYKYNALGLPVLNGNEYFVSLSHSDEYCACAVSDEPVGLDVERSRIVHWKLYDRIRMMDEPTPKDNEEVIELWTQKEAVLKLTGCAITGSLRSFGVFYPEVRMGDEAPFAYVSSQKNDSYWISVAAYHSIEHELIKVTREKALEMLTATKKQ